MNICIVMENLFSSSPQDKTEEGGEEESYFFRVTEAVFVVYFTLEYLLRLVVAPYKVFVPLYYHLSK